MPTTTPTHTPAGWRAGDFFAARVAGLPLSVVEPLRCPDACAWADAVLAQRGRLADDGAHLSDLLHELINANDDDAARRRLLTLRRQVFNNTLPADPAPALAAVEAARPAAVPAVTAWLDLRADLARLEQDGGARFAADTALARTHLWRLADEPRLRGGIQVASPVLDEHLATTAPPDPAAPANKKARRTERSLLSYLYRTACKTSPFSTFTGVAWGRLEDTAAGLDLPVADDWHRHTRLNVVVVARLADLIAADPGRRGDLPVVLSPGWRRDADRIRYVRHWVTAGDDSAAVSFDSVRDGLFFLRRSGVLDRLTAHLHEHGTVRWADLVDWLSAQTGAERPDAEAYLSMLTRLGMLRLLGLDTDVHAADPVRALRAALDHVDRPWAARLSDQLGEVSALVAAYSRADLGGRRDLRHRLRASLHAAAATLGADTAALPQALLYEDARIGGQPLAVPAATWRDMLGPDLAAVEQVLPAFDQTLPHRIMFHGFFLARFGAGGRCGDLLRLVDDFHDDLYDQYSAYTAGRRPFAEDGTYTPEENWLGRPEMAALDTARQSFAARMRELAAADPDAAELRLPPQALAEIGSQLGAAAIGFRPQGHFAQLAQRDDGPLLVLNQSFGGLSFPFSRFTHCFDGDRHDLAGLLREHARTQAPEGAVFAELTGGAATTNLNLHATLTDHVIVCPGETSDLPAERQLTLDDLHLAHDEAADRVVLRSTRLGCEVIPVYLGYLMPMALPQIPRTLLLLSPASMIRLDVWRGVPGVPGPGGITARPRVRVGNTVLSRRSWSLRAGDLPAAGDPGADPRAFLAWRGWRAQHGLPAQVFATVYPADPGRVAANPKPQYVDFDSPLSLQVFQADVDDPGDRVVLREMLPAAGELHARSAHGAHVAELAVETFRTYSRDAR
ncbi:lantibiotic dehydratase [Catellatospora sp. TT07R-123]|uniref:lantibiotic dehydratase n=1 Tax=Catellatospora sp. TT07R-123 TaxID=2733863 RepID=UPI001BB366E0|nr:lantibiotic dehydratase [Catellatospora sp. TT07R-123]